MFRVSQRIAYVSLVLSGLCFPSVDSASGQCTPPPQNILLIAVDAGARRDTAFFGRSASATTGVDTALCERELPPMPPSGVFDLRFANPPGRDGLQPPAGLGQGSVRDYRALVHPAQRDTFRVRFQPGLAGYPMTFSWSVSSLAVICDSARLIDEVGGAVHNVDMLSAPSLAVTNPAIGSLLLILYGVPQIPAAPVLVAPPNAATEESLSPLLLWNPVAGAARYAVQVSADSLFSAPLLNDTAVISPSRTVTGLLPASTYFWRVRGSSGAGAGAWSTVWRFTTIAPPAVPLLVLPANGALGIPSGTLLVWNTAPRAASYHVQLAADSLFAAPVINDASVTDTVRPATPLGGSTRYFWRVAAANGAGEGGWSSVRSFTTAGPITTPHAMTGGWNMISLPLGVADARRGTVYPTASSGAFRFGATGYVPDDSLDFGTGYWLKFPSAQNVPVTGLARALDTLHLEAGWNLIGTISVAVDTGGIQKVPAGLLISPYYGYAGSYLPVATLQPGASYWVKATSPGMLVIAASPTTPSRRGQAESRPSGDR